MQTLAIAGIIIIQVLTIVSRWGSFRELTYQEVPVFSKKYLQLLWLVVSTQIVLQFLWLSIIFLLDLYQTVLGL